METTPRQITNLKDETDRTPVGERVQIGESGTNYFAIYRRIDARSAWAARRRANGENPCWFMEKGEFVR